MDQQARASPLSTIRRALRAGGAAAASFGLQSSTAESFMAGESLGRIGSMELRLAGSAGEVRRAQALRYRVFFQEMSAVASLRSQLLRRDADAFDPICDHLLVLDRSQPPSRFQRQPEIVGTYRLLRQEVAERHRGFYTANEFDIGALLQRKPELRFLELGRSCVLPPYRTKRTLELLWHGVWRYAIAHRADVMIGCASLEGTDPNRLALPLSYLHHYARAPEEWRVAAHPWGRVAMDRLPVETIEARTALRTLPPLIKGYLRAGAVVGDGAVVDGRFGTTDVCVVMPVAAISPRYIGHYGADASRFAA